MNRTRSKQENTMMLPIVQQEFSIQGKPLETFRQYKSANGNP